jgi:hypothetical protein
MQAPEEPLSNIQTLEKETEEVIRCQTAKSMVQGWTEYGPVAGGSKAVGGVKGSLMIP